MNKVGFGARQEPQGVLMQLLNGHSTARRFLRRIAVIFVLSVGSVLASETPGPEEIRAAFIAELRAAFEKDFVPQLVKSGLSEVDAKRVASESAETAISCIFSEIDGREREAGVTIAVKAIGDYTVLFDDPADLAGLTLGCFERAKVNAGLGRS